MLGALLLSANRLLSAESLTETVWDGVPPKGAGNTVRAYVMRLRKTLGGALAARIETHDPGYVMRVEPHEFDVAAFEVLCERAEAAVRVGDRWEEVADTASRALGLWRGTPLVDVPSRRLSDLWIPRFEQQHLQLLEWRIEADLELNRSHALIPEISSILREHPLREPLYRLHMLALAQANRAGEALAVYRGARTLLLEQLGVEPGAELQRLHQQILRGTLPGKERSSIGEQPRESARAVRTVKGPRQLPADTRIFTGRGAELDKLLALARQAEQGTEAGMVVISAINGLGGIGKTALAVRAAHHMADEFVDGQLFIDLRGYSPDHDPVSAGDALDYLLRSLGVPARSIPSDLGERAAVYRSAIADTKMLIILDNASTTAQVRPLLPGAPGCLVLITSRNALPGLDDTHFLALDVLTGDEAISLLQKVVGPARIRSDDRAVPELIALCGHIPLAIRIVAARLRHHRSLSPADLVAELRAEAGRVSRLSDGERDLASVFSSSFRDLPSAERDVFRRLGLIPGPDFDVYCAANLIGENYRSAERLLESLLDHNLLAQHTPGRYRFHDLLRSYARTLPGAPEDDAEAVARVADYYEHIARTAHLLLTHWTSSAATVTAPAPAVAPDIPDRAAALGTMRAELDNVLAMIAHADEHGRTATAVALIGEIGVVLNQDGRWSLAADLLNRSIELSADLGDRSAQARALWNLGSVQRLGGDLTGAIESQERAIDLYRELGDRQGRANAQGFLGMAYAAAGQMANAVGAFTEALSMYRELGDRRGQMNMLQQLGGAHHMMGASGVARDLVEQALAAARELGDANGQAVSLGTLGRICFSDGDFGRAGGMFEACLELFRSLGNRQNEAQAINELSRTRFAVGEYQASIELCQKALSLCRELGFKSGTTESLKGIGKAKLALGDLPGAIESLTRALALEEERGSLTGQANAAHELGRAFHAAGEHARAEKYFGQALTARGSSAARGGESDVHCSIADLLVDTAGPEPALARYQQALELAREVNRPADMARAMEGIGRCLVALGNREMGLEHLRQAGELYQRMGITPSVTLTATEGAQGAIVR